MTYRVPNLGGGTTPHPQEPLNNPIISHNTVSANQLGNAKVMGPTETNPFAKATYGRMNSMWAFRNPTGFYGTFMQNDSDKPHFELPEAHRGYSEG